jgi:hypothetical protein
MANISEKSVELKTNINKALSGNMSGDNIVKMLEENISGLNGKSKTL